MFYSIVKKIFQTHRIMRRLCSKYYSKKEGGVWRSPTLRRLYKECRSVDVGEMSYGWDNDQFEGPVVIGKYCSIGPGVRRLPVNHVTNGITTHPCWFNPSLGWVEKDFRARTRLYIGNDVWIGANVIILPSVTFIGDGAIIAAGAVVTKNVDPYGIYGGVPAHFIKKRFPSNIIELLEKSKWWDIPENRLKKLCKYMDNPENFLDHL